MSPNLFLLIFIISDKVFPLVNSSILSLIREPYENIRGLLDEVNNTTRVKTTEELNAPIGLVQQYEGYKAEEHDVQTEDGYILKLHRIISSPHCSKVANKPVVFMQHGFLGASDIFVYLGPNRGLAFSIADACYDVWLGNVRGNSYSKRHVKYSPASSNYDFWNFNVDDLGLKDAPAMIDAVLEKTNKTKLIYIGHSMGTTMNFMLLSSKTEYNNKIDLSINLAPGAYVMKPYSTTVKFILAIRIIAPALRVLKIYELLPLNKIVSFIAKKLCSNYTEFDICGAVLGPFLNLNNLNHSDHKTLFYGIFNSASLDTLLHFGQYFDTEKFIKYDFGPRLNNEKYNSSEPLEYDLSKITAPQAIFYADDDVFVNSKAAEKERDLLRNVVAFEKVPEDYNHYDLLWAKDAKAEYYYKILDLLEKYSK